MSGIGQLGGRSALQEAKRIGNKATRIMVQKLAAYGIEKEMAAY